MQDRQSTMRENTKVRNLARELSTKSTTNNDNGKRPATRAEVEAAIGDVTKEIEAFRLDRPAIDLPTERTTNNHITQSAEKPALDTPGRNVADSLKIEAATSTPKSLAFRSYKNGTLITNNFLSTVKPNKPSKIIQNFPPAEQHVLHVKPATSALECTKPEATSVLSAVSVPFVAQPQIAKNSLAYEDFTTHMRKSRLSEAPVISDGSKLLTPSTTVVPQALAATGSLTVDYVLKSHGLPTEPNTIFKLKSLIKTIPPGHIKNNYSCQNQLWHSIDRSHQPLNELGLPPKVPRSWIERAEPFKKDILITVDSITHNIRRMKADYDENGNEVWWVTNDYNPERYDVIETLKKMSEREKEVFWMQNWISITLDFGKTTETITESEEEALNPLYPITRLKNSVLETLEKFDKETGMHAYALTVFITIVCPLRKDPNENYQTLTKTQQRSPEFREVADLSREMNKFTNIKKMEVIIMNVSGVRARLTMEQLNYALPFYDCDFEDWSLMWQNEYMTHAESVQNWPITYLDREMHKVHQERERFANRMTGGGGNQDSSLSNAEDGRVGNRIEYCPAHKLQNTRWVKNDARGYTYEHRLEAEETPKRPLEFYRHP